MEVAFTSLPVCRFYSLRVHFCTFDASLFFTPLACVDRIWARLPATSRNFCLTWGTNGFSSWIPTIVSQLARRLAILVSVSLRDWDQDYPPNPSRPIPCSSCHL